jgi:hypothetical protein
VTSRLESRLLRLEAAHDTHPMEGLSDDELRATQIAVEAVIAGAESGRIEVTPELLAKQKMSLEAFEAASAALTPAFCARVADWYVRKAAEDCRRSHEGEPEQFP